MASFNLKKTKEMVVPSKRTMNFCHHKNPVDLKRLIPVLVIVAVVLLLFVKFCIIDMIQVERAAYDRLAEKKAQLAGLEVGLKDYDKVADMYGRFSYGWMNETEVNTVNRLQVLALIEAKVGPAAVVENMAVNDNSLTLNIHGLTLEQASLVVKDLETSNLVSSAIVHNAVANDAEEANIFMSILLKKEAN